MKVSRVLSLDLDENILTRFATNPIWILIRSYLDLIWMEKSSICSRNQRLIIEGATNYHSENYNFAKMRVSRNMHSHETLVFQNLRLLQCMIINFMWVLFVLQCEITLLKLPFLVLKWPILEKKPSTSSFQISLLGF